MLNRNVLFLLFIVGRQSMVIGNHIAEFLNLFDVTNECVDINDHNHTLYKSHVCVLIHMFIEVLYHNRIIKRQTQSTKRASKLFVSLDGNCWNDCLK